MSAIYGFVRLDERPLEPGCLRAMGAAIRYFGSDGGGEWASARAGLGLLVAHHTTESIRETGPLATQDGGVLTAAARLDNRDELSRELGLDRTATESEIVVAAWEKWGEDSPCHLHGDWGFAVWHEATRRLFVARDQFGHTALHYHRDATSLAFAANRKALFALPHVPRRLNELRLAQHLVMWVTDGAATLHEGIFRLPPGHSLVATPTSVVVHRYWRLEDAPEIRLSNGSEYVERFLELYSAAVRTRLRSARGVAVTLSSGLDSGSVTALAARELAGAGTPLTAYTSVLRFSELGRAAPSIVVDEWPLAHAIAEWCGVEHRAVRAEQSSPLKALERSLWIHDEPEYAAANLYWIFALLDDVGRGSADVILTGQMGNLGVSWPGDQQRVQRALVGGHPIAACRELSEWKRSRDTNWLRAVWAQVVVPLRSCLSVHLDRRRAVTPLRHGLIDQQFAHRIDIVERMRASGYDALCVPLLDPRQQRLQGLLPEINPNGALWHEKSAAFGVEVRDPTADVRLLEFCMGVPDEQYAANGRDRLLMRRAMEGMLPSAAQWNVRRGLQAADLGLRLRDDRDNVEALLARMAASSAAREYLDLDAIAKNWATVRGELNGQSFGAATLLARALLFGAFVTGAAKTA